MTDKKSAATSAANAEKDAPVTVTGLLAALNENMAAFAAAQGELIEQATAEATTAGEEFAKLALRPDAEEFEAMKARAARLELELSTAQLQLTEIGTELTTAAEGLRESHDARTNLERDLAAARTTIDKLQEESAADKALIRSMRTRTDALAATFRAAQDALNLDELPAPQLPAPEATAVEEPKPAVAAAPAVDFDFTTPEPQASEFTDPAPVTEFQDPADDDPFKPVRSIGTFRPASLPDAGFNPPAPEEEAIVQSSADNPADVAPHAEDDGKEPESPAEDAAPAGLDLPSLELPDLEAPAAGGGLELPDLELTDLELPGPAGEPAKVGLDLTDLDDLELPAAAEAPAKAAEPAPAAADFGLLELPDLEPAPAR